MHGPSGAVHSWASACRHTDMCVRAGSCDTSGLKHPGVGWGWAWLGDGSEPEADQVITVRWLTCVHVTLTHNTAPGSCMQPEKVYIPLAILPLFCWGTLYCIATTLGGYR